MIQKRNCKRCGPGILEHDAKPGREIIRRKTYRGITRCATAIRTPPTRPVLVLPITVAFGKACLPPKPHSSGCRFSHTSTQLHHYFGRNDIEFVPNGVDLSHFSPGKRLALRAATRQSCVILPKTSSSFSSATICATKGGPSSSIPSIGAGPPLRLCVVGSDHLPTVSRSSVGCISVIESPLPAKPRKSSLFMRLRTFMSRHPWKILSILPALEAMAWLAGRGEHKGRHQRLSQQRRR